MSRKSTLEPGWLVSMLTCWVRHCIKLMDSGLGYPNKTTYLKDYQPRNRSSYGGVSLFNYDADDFLHVEQAMQDLSQQRPELYVAVTMYYKPWTVNSFVAQGFPFKTRNYYYRLHDAHEWLAGELRIVEERYRVEPEAVC